MKIPDNPKIVVLLPCYNEEVCIVPTIADFQIYLPEAQIIVFDNNSTDNTATVADRAGATVIFSPERGKGNVIRHMFAEIDADIYLLCDGDYTYPAKDAPKFISAIRNGADMVIGDRLSANYYESNYKLFHNFGNKLVRFLVNRLWHSDIPDIMTGYRAFTKDFVQRLQLKSKGFEIETEITIQALQKKAMILSFPISYRDRISGSVSKIHTLTDGFKILKFIISAKLKELYRNRHAVS